MYTEKFAQWRDKNMKITFAYEIAKKFVIVTLAAKLAELINRLDVFNRKKEA